MACSKCGKNKTPVQRGRMVGKPGGTSIMGEFSPHHINERQGPRKQRIEEQQREIRKSTKRGILKRRPKMIRRAR